MATTAFCSHFMGLIMNILSHILKNKLKTYEKVKFNLSRTEKSADLSPTAQVLCFVALRR